MLKKITVEEAVMLVIKSEYSRLYVKEVYSGGLRHQFVQFRDASVELHEINSLEFWLMTDDE